MIGRIKRKLIINKKINTVFVFIFFLLISFTSIGFSALSQNLMISGDVDYYVNSNKLYDVFKRAVKEGTYVKEYTGSHQDSYAGVGTKKIYYWYGSNDTNGTAIQNMNNVIFAGQCWQMIRTTDTGGVKMIYNGEAVDNQCLNTRGNHIGYAANSSQTLSGGNYYYGTSYAYDSVNQVFSLSGVLEQATWNATTGPTLIGKYTCKSTSSDGTCATLYLINSYSSSSAADTLQINSSSHYSQFGKVQYETSRSSPAFTGYMRNNSHAFSSVSSTSFTITSTSGWTINSSYYYSDTIDYGNVNDGKYTLTNPVLISTLADTSELVGKYILNTSATSATTARYVTAVSSGKAYYKELSNGNLNTSLTIGDSYTESGGVYTLSGNVTNVSYIDWYTASDLSVYKGKYVCDGNNTSCSKLMHVRTDVTSSKNSFSYWDSSRKYLYSEDVSYSNGTYTLTGDIKSIWDVYAETSTLSTHHYSCWSSESSCTDARYIIWLSSGTMYYVPLSGLQNISALVDDMLYANNVNTKNSNIKTAIDYWYAKYLSSYDSYIEDTIFCNDRTAKTIGSYKPDGGSLSSGFQFQGYTANNNLGCDRITDQFSTLNNNAKLIYKVGLMTKSEMNILNNSNVRKTGQGYWLMTPSSTSASGAVVTIISTAGAHGSGTVNNSGGQGVRPAISLVPDIEFISGDGSMESPYIVDAESTQVNPEEPQINSSATTRVYGSSPTTITCSTPTTYENGMNAYYSFGYADSDGGTPSNWTTPTTTNTLIISPTEYIGQRWYSCRVYATDGNIVTDTVSSSPENDSEVTINNATLSFNTTVNGGTGGGTVYARNGETGVYTEIRGSVAGTIPTASKSGYTLTGWYTASTGGDKVLNSDGTFTGTAVNGYTTTNAWAVIENKSLYAQFIVTSPEVPTISGGEEKVYNQSATTLTCATTSTYPTGINIYYEFGYSTTSGGAVTWLGSPSTTNTLNIEKTAYRGTRYYTCRVYAKEGSNNSTTVDATTTTTMTLVNARIYFDATTNGGAISGTNPLYVSYGQTNIYTGRTNATGGTIPSANKGGWTFNGWYTAANGGSLVINPSKVVQANVNNWTDGSKNWLRTGTTDDNTTNVLYAQYSANSYTISYTWNGGEGGSNKPTTGNYDSDVVVSKPSKTFTVNIDANSQGASITSGGNAVTEASSVQTFAGWTASNLNTTTALYGSTSNPTTTWNGTTKVGASEATTYFKNLRDSSGTVTLIANWTAVAVTLPKIEKTGYACGYAISAGGAIVYQSEGSYTPSVTTESDTLYARCEVRMLMQHNSTTSQTFGKSISRDSFESITTLNSKTVPGNAIDSWDVSSEQNGSVMSWYTDTDSDGKYELYIGQDGGVKANTDSSYAFYSFQNLDSIDLTYFDTSSVTNMSQMFSSTGRNSTVFTLDLGDNFDTSSVTNMNGMFRETGYSSTVFTLDLGDNFDTSNVTNMVSMFSYTGRSSTVFTLDLGDNFDTSNVTNMNSMFNQTGYSSTVFTLDLGDKFDTSNVTSINQMFNQTGYSSTEFTLDLGDKFDTSNVIDMYQMFNQTGYSSTVFTLDLGDNFDTSNVTNMGSMFSYTGYNSTEFTLDLGDNFDTSSVTMMDSMFCSTGRSSTVFTLDLGDRFDTSNVTNMLRMFNQTGRNSTVFTLDLGDNFDTSNVTNMSYMFRETGYSSTVFTLDLGDNFDTSNVTDMSSMFYYTGRSSTVFTLDLGDNFDTSNVTNMSSMFYYTGYSNTVFTLDLRDKFDTSSVTNMFSMFYYTGYSNTTFEIDIMQFDFSNVTTYNDIFTGWRTTNTIWVKDAADQSWVITNSANSNLTTSNVLYPNFATDTWERIVANIESGNTDNYHVGDTKEVDLGSLGTHTLRIANMSTPDACSGSTYSQTACGFVLEFADLLGTRAMHSSATNVGGWPGTTMRTYVNSTVYDALPEALRRGIIDTKTISGHGSTSGESNWTSTDKLYLLSMVEVYGANYTNDSLQTTQTRQLDYYSQIGVTTSSYAGAIKNNGTTATAWRLRSAGSNNTTYYNYINASGNRANASATTAYGVSPAFRIGAHPFETDSWETIVTNVQNGNTGNYYVGDTKEVNLGALGVHTLRLINKATPSACSSTPSYSETACGFVVEFSDIITTNSMNTTDTNVGGWPASSLRTYINNDIYNALPSALKNGIINTTVVSSHENGVSNNYVSTDKLYLLSYVEIYGSDYTNDSLKTTQTRQMDYYSREAVTSSSYAKVIKQNSGTDSVWWLRPASTASSNFFIVDTVGKWGGSSATTANGVSPAFRIGASSFKTDTWETIIENVQLGNTDNYNVGDTKRVDLGSLGLHMLRIANKSTPSACDGSSYSQTACGFVLEFVDLLGTRAMHSSATNVGGWPGTTMRTYVNGTVYDALPAEIRNGIINTKVISGHGSTSGESNWVTTDKMYLLDTVEIHGANYTNDSLQTSQTRQLDYYSSKGVTTSSYAAAVKNNGTTATIWRLRSAGSNNATYYNNITAAGARGNGSATTAYGVAPAFRIGMVEPTISGGTEKIYGSSVTTLTCTASGNYGTGISTYYSFGYADSNGGTPGNWTTPSTESTLSIPATEYVGQRWYSCRVYITDGTFTSPVATSFASADTELTIDHAMLTFDATTNGGSGGGSVYTKTGSMDVYTGIRNSTIGTIPTVTPAAGYVLTGWYDVPGGGNKILNADGTFTGAVVNGYTSANAWAVTEDKTLYAQYTGLIYNVGYTMNGGVKGASGPTSGVYEEDIIVSKPTKTFTVNIDPNSQGASITSGGNAVTEASSVQTFAGWTASNLNTSTALYGSTANPTNSWDGVVKVGANDATTYFKNLRTESGVATLVANWTAVAVTLPKIEKADAVCAYATSAGGSVVYQSEGSYTPSVTGASTTLYVRCFEGMIPTTMSLSSDSGTLTYGTNETVTITTNGDGALSCSSSDDTVATCSVSGATLTIVPQAKASDNQTATITVSQAQGTIYLAANATYSATVNRQTLTCPSSPTAMTYDGNSHESGVTCPTGSTPGGTTSATNAGDYSQTCTATDGYKFSSSCSVPWTISKKTPTMSLSSTSATIDCGDYVTVTVTSDGDGTLTCSTSNSNYATCTVTATNKVRIYAGGKSGTATITITKQAGTNYSSISKTFSAKGKKCITWTYYANWGDAASCTTNAYCPQPCSYNGYSYWSCTSGGEPTSASQSGGGYCWCGN